LEISGWLFDGKSSARRSARVQLDSDKLVLLIEGETEPKPYPRKSVTIRERVGDSPRVFEFPEGQRFESPENDKVDRHFIGATGLGFVHWLENNWMVVCVSLVALIGATWACYKYVLPAAARYAAYHTPQKAMFYASGAALKFMEGNFDPSSLNEKDSKLLEDCFNRLQQQFPGYPLKLRKFKGRISAMNINAFALPDGTVVVLDGLVELLRDPDELMAVFMHEMGHVVYRHGMQGIIQAVAVSGFFMFVSGGADWSSLMGAAAMNKFSRDHEREADYFAAQELPKIKLRAGMLADALMHMERELGGGREAESLGFLSSHPMTKEREDYLRSYDPPQFRGETRAEKAEREKREQQPAADAPKSE
jgi:Zn-dependent protease with chaperone function